MKSSSEWTPTKEFRHQAQFQAPAPTRDAMGGVSQTWTTYFSPWAKVEVFTGKMLYQTEEFISETTHMVTVRYPLSAVSISPQDRIAVNSQVFVIDAVMNVKQLNRELRILCHVLNESD